MNKHFVNATLDSSEGGQPRFPTSQWSLVAAASAQGPKAQVALGELYCLYCCPVYAFIRRRGYGRQDAQDLTQYFFVHLLEKATLGKADSQRGRFRSFLLGALGHFLAHADERARAQKRGGGVELVSLDVEKAESGYEVTAPDDLTPEKVLDKRWAVTLNEVARGRLHQEMEAKNKGRLFETLQGFVLGEENASYQEVADRLGLNLNGLKTHIYRLRNRYGELLREEVARTVARPEEVDEELRYLIRVLRR
jgi:DNA-directed RNA polymerase specialized sigma24 family protein